MDKLSVMSIRVDRRTDSAPKVQEILESKVRSIAGQTLPPQGLFLEEVYY